MTQADWRQIEKEFPGIRVPVPPTCVAFWDLDSWRKWYTDTGMTLEQVRRRYVYQKEDD